MTIAMAKTILVCGFGPGISNSVAERFGKAGFQVALVARNAERLAEGAKRLQAAGITAQTFVADLGSPETARAVVGKVRDAMGPISVVQWTAYSGVAGDLTTANAADVRALFDVAVASLLAVVQEALPDLRAQKGAVLVTNGGLGYANPKVDAVAVSWNAMGLSVANAAKHKLVGVLAKKLESDGIYVGEVVVNGTVKGTAFDNGNATIDPADIGIKFWELYESRSPTFVNI